MERESIEKGTIIEIEVPDIKIPIKAVVIDTIHHIVDNREYFSTLILYAQKRLFKAECIGWKVEDYNELGEPNVFWEYTEPHYDGIIIDYCDIPSIPSDF